MSEIALQLMKEKGVVAQDATVDTLKTGSTTPVTTTPVTTPPAPAGEEVKVDPVVQAPAAQGEEIKTGETVVTSPVTVTDIVPPTDPPATPSSDEDAALIAALKSRGIEVDSIDALKKPAPAAPVEQQLTAEQQQELEQRMQMDAWKYGVDNKLFTPAELEAYHAERSQDPRALALKLFKADLLARDPQLAEQMKTDKEGANEEIAQRFAAEYSEHEPEGHWKRVRAEQRMAQEVNSYIDSKYEKVIGATDAFTQELEVRKAAAEYKGKVEKVVAALPTQLTVEVEGKSYTYNIPDTSRTSIRDEFLKTETFKNLNNGNIAEESLSATLTNALREMEWKKATVEIAKAHASQATEAIRLGRKNIPVESEPGGATAGVVINKPKSQAQQDLEAEIARKNRSYSL